MPSSKRVAGCEGSGFFRGCSVRGKLLLGQRCERQTLGSCQRSPQRRQQAAAALPCHTAPNLSALRVFHVLSRQEGGEKTIERNIAWAAPHTVTAQCSEPQLAARRWAARALPWPAAQGQYQCVCMPVFHRWLAVTERKARRASPSRP